MSEKLRNTGEGTRTLFEAIFANPEHTEFALDLYNAIEGTHYKNPKEDVRVLELPRGVYICVEGKGLLVWNQMNVFADPFEWTPDKTVEGFIYLISALDRIEPELKNVMSEEEFAEFSMPHFVALYTGDSNAPAKESKNIAEAFENQNSGDITFRMEIYNVLSMEEGSLPQYYKSEILSEYLFNLVWIRDHLFYKNRKLEDIISCLSESELPFGFKTNQFFLGHMDELILLIYKETGDYYTDFKYDGSDDFFERAREKEKFFQHLQGQSTFH